MKPKPWNRCPDCILEYWNDPVNAQCERCRNLPEPAPRGLFPWLRFLWQAVRGKA